MADRDIVDDIDALIDDQLDAGEPATGYDHGDPQFPDCPHCERHWHGLPLTLQVAVMYSLGIYDPEYDAAKDNSPIVCHGSESDLPMPEFTDDMHRLSVHYTAVALKTMGRIPSDVDIADLIADVYGPGREPVRPEWMRGSPDAPEWIHALLDRTWSWVQDIARTARAVEPQQRRGYTADRVILDENYDLSTDDDPLSRHQRLLDRMRATVTVVIGDGE